MLEVVPVSIPLKVNGYIFTSYNPFLIHTMNNTIIKKYICIQVRTRKKT